MKGILDFEQGFKNATVVYTFRAMQLYKFNVSLLTYFLICILKFN